MYVRPDVKAYLDAAAAQGGPSIVELDPRDVREMARRTAAVVEAPACAVPRRDVAIPARDGGQIPARLYLPATGNAPAPLIVFYHGGGWVLGDVAGYDPLCSEIATRTGLTLLSVDYRLAPEHPFPAAVEDALDAAAWAAAGPAAIGHPVSGLILAGDSAGGALALVAARDRIGHPVRTLAQLLVYPVTDLTRMYPSDLELSPLLGVTEEGREIFYRHYLGSTDMAAAKRHPHVSPLLSDVWRGLPPTVLLTCSLDPLRDQGRALGARLVEHGIATTFIEAEGQVHASFTMRRLIPSTERDLAAVLAALRCVLVCDVAAPVEGVAD